MPKNKHGKLIEYQYRVLPSGIYKDWVKGYIKTLSQKEVERLNLDMPELGSGLIWT